MTGILTTLLILTPFRYALISGIPEPAAAGMYQQNIPAIKTRNIQKN